MALRAFGVGPGDRVGITAYTCLSVVEAVRRTGATCVFLDVDEWLSIDAAVLEAQPPGSLEALIAQYTFGVPSGGRRGRRRGDARGVPARVERRHRPDALEARRRRAVLPRLVVAPAAVPRREHHRGPRGAERRGGGLPLTKVIGETAYVDTIASRNDMLKCNVNDALIFAFAMNAARLPAVRNVHYAIKSKVASLEKFKTGLGFIPHPFPARTHLRGPNAMLLRTLSGDNDQRMTGHFEDDEPQAT